MSLLLLFNSVGKVVQLSVDLRYFSTVKLRKFAQAVPKRRQAIIVKARSWVCTEIVRAQ